ncbi:hypothetical protein LMG26684_00139 [Achromobacter mucicolens]|uniref:hypothetical protein n=1 Tax=Achromobacter mucicolens TaxID=1389922 RepID=UPI0014657BEF|nr:hypothetical protein [Achromobacter mucicolens]CAB3814079.1 hypothetical protein LMG26684_00139 [Achromobacter mucicolens]
MSATKDVSIEREIDPQREFALDGSFASSEAEGFRHGSVTEVGAESAFGGKARASKEPEADESALVRARAREDLVDEARSSLAKKYNAEANKLVEEGQKHRADASRLVAEVPRIAAETQRLHADAQRLHAETANTKVDTLQKKFGMVVGLVLVAVFLVILVTTALGRDKDIAAKTGQFRSDAEDSRKAFQEDLAKRMRQ